MIHLHVYSDETCELGTTLNRDIPANTCFQMAAYGLRAEPPEDAVHFTWAEDPTKLCALQVFALADCDISSSTAALMDEADDLTSQFGSCIHPGFLIRSAMFNCVDKSQVEAPLTTTYVETTPVVTSFMTSTPVVTSFITSFMTSTTLSMITFTTTVTTHYNPYNVTTPFTATMSPATVSPRAVQGHYNPKALWMRNPWTGRSVCWSCWMKHVHDTGNFECESGPNVYAQCRPGDRPKRDVPIGLAKREDHVNIKLLNPYDLIHSGKDRYVCADAEQHHHFSDAGNIKIEDVGPCDPQKAYIDISSA